MRTPGFQARQPFRRRGKSAEGGRGCLPRQSWCVREYLADCHKHVERYPAVFLPPRTARGGKGGGIEEWALSASIFFCAACCPAYLSACVFQGHGPKIVLEGK